MLLAALMCYPTVPQGIVEPTSNSIMKRHLMLLSHCTVGHS
jgi:hypothetical protein